MQLDLSPNSLRVLESRYLRRDVTEGVETPEEMFHRVARALAGVGSRGLIETRVALEHDGSSSRR